jgi:hypothetical protein
MKSPEIEVYGVSTRYILRTKYQHGGCQRDRDPSAKTGYAGSSIPSIWRVLSAWTWSCRVGCLEGRGEPFSWHIFHGSNVRVVGWREHGQRLWYVPPPLPQYNPLVIVESP